MSALTNGRFVLPSNARGVFFQPGSKFTRERVGLPTPTANGERLAQANLLVRLRLRGRGRQS